MMDGRASEAAVPKPVMIDATFLEAHGMVTSLRSRNGGPAPTGSSDRPRNGRYEHILHAVTDADGRPAGFFIIAGQVSDCTRAAAPICSLRSAAWLPTERRYVAGWLLDALRKRIGPCIPSRKTRGKLIKHYKRRDRRRTKSKLMFGQLKDWRRVATRYDRCRKVFLSAAALAARVLSWL
jgi:transposase